MFRISWAAVVVLVWSLFHLLVFSLFFSGPVRAQPAPERVVILFDRSGSMKQLLDGVPKIQMGRMLFAQLAREFDGNEHIAVRFFAGGQAGSREENCRASKLVLPFGKRATGDLAALSSQLWAKGRKTPLAKAIELATTDLKGWTGPRRIIIISDGMDTCGEDPLPMAEDLGAGGMIFNVVGLGKAADLAQLAELGLSSGADFALAASYGDFAGAMSKMLPAMPAMPAKPMAMPTGSGGRGGAAGGQGAQVPLRPLPPDQLIKVELRLKPDNAKPDPVAVEIILDVSGSMAAWLKGKSKMSLALAALEKSIGTLEAPHITVGLRAYGFDASVAKTPEASCPNTELVTDFAPEQTAAIVKAAKSLPPYGYTPIAASITAAGVDLKPYEDQTRQIILITDGEETCGGDPISALRALAGICVNVNAHIIGFDLEPKARAEMQAISAAGCGIYLDAPDGMELEKAMIRIITQVAKKTQVDWDRFVNPVTGGASFEDAMILGEGAYTFENHLDKGEKQYFRIPLTKAQRLRMVVTAQGRLVRFDDQGKLVEHAAYDFTSFWGDFLNARGDRIKGPGGRLTFRSAKPGTQKEIQLLDMQGDGITLLVIANAMKINKDTRMDLLIDEAGDLVPGYDAPDAAIPGMRTIEPGQNVVGHIGLQDRKDLFYLTGLTDASYSLTVNFNPTNPEFKYRLVVARADTGRRLKRFNGLTGPSDRRPFYPPDRSKHSEGRYG